MPPLQSRCGTTGAVSLSCQKSRTQIPDFFPNPRQEETKRAKKQGWITVGIFIVIWIIINRIQSFIIKLLTPVGLPIAMFFARVIGIGLAVFILLVLYRYSKKRHEIE